MRTIKIYKYCIVLVCASIVFNYPLSAQAQSAPQKDRPQVALVLSGGGAKGVAHIGAIKVIEQAGIPIDMVCGTSMGALIGALYSMGYSSQFLDSLVRSQDWTDLLSDRTDPAYLSLRGREEQNTYTIIRGLGSEQLQRGGIIRGHNLELLFRRLCAAYPDSISFDSLPRRFACVATDIVSYKEVVFHSGNLTKAMRASMAIPGVFTPVRMGNMVLLDGGLRNNYPADVARAMGADVVIGVSVQDEISNPDNIKGLGDVMGQLVSHNSRNKFQENSLRLSDVFIHVDVNGFSAASFTNAAIDSLLQRGEMKAVENWNQLINVRNKYHLDTTGRSLPVPQMAPAESEGIHTINITKYPVASAGFRFDTEEMGSLQLGIKYPLHWSRPTQLTGTVRLGKRFKVKGEASMLSEKSVLNPTLAYTFMNNDLDIYVAGRRTYNVRYRQQTVELTPFDLRHNHFDIRIGLRWDYFDYYGQLLSTSSNIPTITDDHYFSYYYKADLNNENDWYFPTRGNRLHAALYYRTTNMLGYNNGIGIGDITAHWRVNLTLGSRLTIQPMLYTRLLVGYDIPLAYKNFLGGEWFGHTVEQQLPFAGLGHIEAADNYLGAAQLQLHYRLFKDKKQYILLRAAVSYQTDNLLQYNNEGLLLGFQAGYSYNTIIGPLDGRIGYSSLTHKPYFLVNIGHVF